MAEFARAAIEKAVAKQAKKAEGTAQQAAIATDSRQRSELEAAVKNETHKLGQVQEVAQKFEALMAGGCLLWLVCCACGGRAGGGSQSARGGR